jgi:hypothetical protein
LRPIETPQQLDLPFALRLDPPQRHRDLREEFQHPLESGIARSTSKSYSDRDGIYPLIWGFKSSPILVEEGRPTLQPALAAR